MTNRRTFAEIWNRSITRIGTIEGRHILTTGMVAMFLFLIFRNSGIYPVVFGDEWSYSSFSRLMPLAEVPVPSYLYFYLYGKTSFCGDNFLGCARAFNNIFFVASMPLIYLIAKRICSSWVAAVVAIVSAGSALNTYTAYFMPEAMYFFAFWGFSWVVLSLKNTSPVSHGLLTGVSLGSMALIKVHAIFLLPGVLVFIAYSTYLSPQGPSKWKMLLSSIATVLSFLGTKLVLGYVAAGKSGLTILGNLYGAQASSVMGVDRYVQIALQTIESFHGHLMALSLLFGLPLAMLLLFSPKIANGFADDTERDGDVRTIQAYTICILVPLVLVAAAFTASVAGSGPYESIGRLHIRYYNFALPLLLIVAASQLSAKTPKRLPSFLSALLVSLVSAYSLWYLLTSFTPSMVDSPELRGFVSTPWIFYTLGASGIVTTLAWAFNRKWGATLFVFVFMPMTAAVTTYQVSTEVRQRQTPDKYDNAGLFVRRYLGSATSQLTIVAPDVAASMRTLFHIDNPKTKTLTLASGVPLDFSILSAQAEWLLLIGDYELPKNIRYRLPLGEFTLARIAREDILDFRKASWPGIVSRSRGLAAPESWGSWTDGREVMLEFTGGLPKDFQLFIKGYAFGPVANQALTVSVGDDERNLPLTSTPQQVSFTFKTDGLQRILKINVPVPISPQSLGMSDDIRQLGVALSEMRIIPAPATPN